MAKPSLAMLRELTDETVLRALMSGDSLTRAEIASTTGLSKPTAGESVRRLEALGLVADTGRVTQGRGGVGIYYALPAHAGVALAVSLAPEGVVAEVVGPDGGLRTRVTRPVERPVSRKSVGNLLTAAVREALPAGQPVRVTVVSAADPVSRSTGSLVQLPDSPFLLGALAPAELLAPLTGSPVLVDNDVNWAARAEARARGGEHRDFVYLYLGEGLGCAVVADAEVRRGHGGLAGEVSHVVTTDGEGRARTFLEVFAELGLRRAGTTAIDVERLMKAVRDPAVARVLGRAVGGVLSGAVAFLDPEFVVLGGPWAEAVRPAVREQMAALPRPIPLEPASVTLEPALTGVRAAAHEELQRQIVHLSRS